MPFLHLTTKGYSMSAARLEFLIYEKRGEEEEVEEKGVRRRREQTRLGQGKCGVGNEVYSHPSRWRGGNQPRGGGSSSYWRDSGGGGDNRHGYSTADPREAAATAVVGGEDMDPPEGLTKTKC